MQEEGKMEERRRRGGTMDREAVRKRVQDGKEKRGLELGKGQMKNRCRG